MGGGLLLVGALILILPMQGVPAEIVVQVALASYAKILQTSLFDYLR